MEFPVFSQRKNLIVLLCLAVLVLQVGQLAARFAPLASQIRRDIGKASAWRGLNLAFGREAAEYLEFVNHRVSLDATVLLGISTGPEYLARPVDLQAFLYPRHIYNCPGEGYLPCLMDIETDKQAALIIDAQTAALIEGSPAYKVFAGRWGLLFAGEAPGELPAIWRDYSSAAEFALGFLPPLLFVLLMTAPAVFYCALRWPASNAPLHIGAGLALGLGVHSLLVFIALLLGVELTPGLVLLAALLPWATLILLRGRLRIFDWQKWLDLPRWWPLFLVGGVFGGAALFFAAGSGYSHVDEYLLWAAKGYGIVATDLETGVSLWGTLTVRYPLNVILHIASFVSLFGDRLPESKIIFPVFYVALLFVIGGWIAKRTGSGWSLWGVLVLASSPLLFLHGTLGYANLPLSLYLVSAFIIGVLEVSRKSSPRSTWLSGFLFLLAAWTRPEGLAIGAVLAATLVVLYWRLGEQGWLRAALGFVLPLAVFALAWSLIAPTIYQDVGFAQGMFTAPLGSVFSGNIHWAELAFTLQSLLTYFFSLQPIAWGGLGLFAAASFMAWLAWHGRVARPEVSHFFAGLCILAIIAGGYFVTSYSPGEQDVSWWVFTGMDRMIMPGVILIWLAAFTGIVRFTEPVETPPAK